MDTGLASDLAARTAELREQGLFKAERVMASPQGGHIELEDGRRAINLCANNYLGLANHPALVEAARQALLDHGYGMASVRFICGTQTVHRHLEDFAFQRGGPSLPEHQRPHIGVRIVKNAQADSCVGR